MKTETKQVTLFIQADKASYESEFSMHVRSAKFESDSFTTVVHLDTVVVNVEIPVLDEKMLALAEVENLQANIKAEKVASYIRITQMEERINNLMCLENKLEE